MATKSRIYHISGRVQGVGFRQFTLQQARKLGLRGFVRNLPDGRVECQATGTELQLYDLESQLARGPAFGRVDQVHSRECDPGPEKSFEITY